MGRAWQRALGLVVVLAANASNAPSYENYTFEEYLAEFEKSYGQEEHANRKLIFEESLQKVRAHNLEYESGAQTWFAVANQLADWSPEEFAQLRATQQSPSNLPLSQLLKTSLPLSQLLKTQANPDSLDWRTKGAVSAVKNQGGCGSCWAFSAAESVESHYQIASGKLLTLAPQTYVNCVQNPQSCGGTGGCQGATMELAFNFTVQEGIALESDMPYTARDQSCPSFKAAVKAAGYVKNPVNDAAAFETALATKGPMSVTVAAGSWQLYGGGIFQGCSKGQDETLDHGVQAVGYTKDYWIVRNSWGPGWGEKGYIRLSRASDAQTFINKDPADGTACKPLPKSQTIGGECGILFDTSYPHGVSAASEGIIV